MTTPKQPSSQKSAVNRNTTGANLNDVLIHLIDSIYNLVNSGNIVGVIALYLCFQTYTIVDKLAQNDLAEFIRSALQLEYFYAIAPSIVSVLILYWALRQKKMYEKRIQDLINIRKKLMHGQSSGKSQPLKKHRSSGIERTETNNDC